MKITEWNNIELKLISITTVWVLIWDLCSIQGLSFIPILLDLALVVVGIILLFNKRVFWAGNFLVIGYDIALLLYGTAGVIFIRSYRPSLMLVYFLRYVLFACGVIYSQQIFRTLEEISNNIYRILFFRTRLTNRNRQFLIATISIFLFFFLVIGFYPMVSCAFSGGEYTVGGLIGAEYCLHRYSDGGKACLSSIDCEGDCVLSELNLPSNFPIQGVCKSDNNPYGCFSYVENGQVILSSCID